MVRTPFFDELTFRPDKDDSCAIEPDEVASTICDVLQARSGTVFDEINLSPQKRVIDFKKGR